LAKPSAHLNWLNTVFVSDTAVVFKMHLVLWSLDWVAVLWGVREKLLPRTKSLSAMVWAAQCSLVLSSHN